MNENKTKKYLNDKIATIIFTDCRDFVIKVVSLALNISEDIIKDNLILTTPRINSNINFKYSEVDAIYENNTSIINIEINYNNSKYLQNKNMRYVCQMILKQVEIGNKDILKPIYQININNFDFFNHNKFIYRSSVMEEELHLKRGNYLTIIDINVDFLRNIDYTDIKRMKEDSLERLLYIFVCDNKEIRDKLYLGDKIMDEVQKKLDLLNENLDYYLYYDGEEIKKQAAYELGMNEGEIKGKAEGLAEGLAEGRTEGAHENKLEIAKGMLKDGIPDETILKYVKISASELKSFKENN